MVSVDKTMNNTRPLLGQLMTINELEGYDIMGYFMRGHVDKTDFAFEMLEENDLVCNEEDIIHTYARYTPVRSLDDMMMIFVNEPARGAFKITHIDDYNTTFVLDVE